MPQSPEIASLVPLVSDAARFREMEDVLLGRKSPPEIDSAVELLRTFRLSNQRRIYLNQRVSEWKRFLQFLQDRGFPRTILEIGTGRGGSAFFWSRFSPPGAHIVTVDLDPAASDLVAIYHRPGANPVDCITGNSTAPATVDAIMQTLDRLQRSCASDVVGSAVRTTPPRAQEAVRKADPTTIAQGHLGDRPVDLLYIDGDHSYEGVEADFERYRQFCAPNSLIAFHDIHPDFFQSRGIKTSCDSGLVYKFWNELKARYPSQEFIEEPRAEQDGFGIGVIEYVG